MLKILLSLLLFVFISLVSSSQGYSYIRFDTRDGLAGSTVYDITQDKDGFVWFATEAGLSRFDGKNFTTFTVKDGMPDNEVLKIFADSKGRVWIGSFSNQICYYYKDKIYNANNDTLLRKVNLDGIILKISEHDGKIIFYTRNKQVYFIDADKGELNPNVNLKNLISGTALITLVDDFNYLGAYSGRKKFIYNHRLQKFVFDGHLQGGSQAGQSSDRLVVFRRDRFEILKTLKAGEGYINFSVRKNSLFFCNTANGSFLTSLEPSAGWLYHFLPGVRVVSSFIDSEDNYWFATLGDGVYKLPSREIRTFYPDEKLPGLPKEIFCITKQADKIVAGLNLSRVLELDKESLKKVVTYHKSANFLNKDGKTVNRTYVAGGFTGGRTVFGFDGALGVISKGKALFAPIFPVKSVTEIDSEYMLAGTHTFVFKIRTTDLKIVDTIWQERCTNVFYFDNYYYIGTLQGLYRVDKEKHSLFLGNINPFFRSRVSGIVNSADSVIWVATSDRGVGGYKNGRLVKIYSAENGLSSSNCRSVFISNNYLWVGTDKGLNKINLLVPAAGITQYMVNDGLPSNIMNAVYIEDSLVWVGSPAGLSYFNENKIHNSNICNLSMTGVFANGLTVDTDSVFAAAYKNNSIGFAFAGVSIRSAGDITYYYRLAGLDTNWKATRQNRVDYQLLPPGSYNWEVYAINKFGLKSNIVRIPFIIKTPFYKSWWFYIPVALLSFFSMGLFFHYRNIRHRKALIEKDKINQQFASLEQQALQAQMNPHFIFNCLNSIQQYIVTGDKEKANAYLTGFALLIRQTLEFSEKKSITVAEEAAYLKRYLDMEKLRYANGFNYTIKVDEAAEAGFMELPALLLQPYVENCLRHGIRYQEKGTGEILVHFKAGKNALVCIIQDNGVGRAVAEMNKRGNEIQYQSKGMGLTQKRIDLLNQVNRTNIHAAVNDLTDTEGNPAGTQVVITIPI